LKNFLDFIGKKVALKDWERYSGGLDTKKDATGTHSYFTTLHEAEIMFHVSTLIPNSDPIDSDSEDESSSPKETCVINKKIHIGNDIVIIIYNDGDSPFSPDCINSQFNHVFIVVQKLRGQQKRTMYRVSVAYKRGVDKVKPSIPVGTIFEATKEFRKLLIAKVINSERSAYRSPGFADSLQRMRCQFLLHLHQCSFNKKLSEEYEAQRHLIDNLKGEIAEKDAKIKDLEEKLAQTEAKKKKKSPSSPCGVQ